MSDHIKSLEQCLFQAQNAAIDLVAQIKALENQNKDLLKAARDSKWEERQKVEKEFHAIEARLKAAEAVCEAARNYIEGKWHEGIEELMKTADPHKYGASRYDLIRDSLTAWCATINAEPAPHDAQTPASPPRQGLEAWVGTDISASAHEPSPPKPE